MFRLTLGMVVVFAAGVIGVWVLQTKNPAPTEGAPTYLLEVNQGDVQRLDVTASGGSAAFERIEPVGWKFAESGQQADSSRVDSVVNRLAKLRSNTKVLDQVTDRAAYGLDPAPVAGLLTMKDGTTHRFLIGKETVNNAAYYAMAEEKGVLHTINTLIVGDMQKLVTEPPVPTTGPGPSPSPGGAEAGTPVPGEAAGTATPTLGLPVPSVN